MTKSLLPSLCDLACDKFGSRVLEVIYKASEMEMKQKMVNVLASDESKLSANFYGRFVLRNCKVARYKEAGAEACSEATSAGVVAADLPHAQKAPTAAPPDARFPALSRPTKKTVALRGAVRRGGEPAARRARTPARGAVGTTRVTPAARNIPQRLPGVYDAYT